jgi:hypothetical protein
VYKGETSEPGAMGAVQFLLGSGWPVGDGPPDDKLRHVLKFPDAVSSRVRRLPLHEALTDAEAQVTCLTDVNPLLTSRSACLTSYTPEAWFGIKTPAPPRLSAAT